MSENVFDMEIKSQDEMVMFEVIAKELHSDLNKLILANQPSHSNINENNRQLLTTLLNTNDKNDLNKNLNGKYDDLSRIDENYIDSMGKITVNLSKFFIKTIDASEKCIEFLKLIKKSISNKTKKNSDNNQSLISLDEAVEKDEEISQDLVSLSKCMLCSFTYSNNKSIELHLMLKHQVKKQCLDNIIQNRNSKRPIPTSMINTYLNTGYKPFNNETKKYACKNCPYKTNNLTDLNRHVTRHIFKENSFKCRYCNYYVLKMCNMERHEIMHTTQFQPNNENRNNFELSKKFKRLKHKAIYKQQQMYKPRPPSPPPPSQIPVVQVQIPAAQPAQNANIQQTYQSNQTESIVQGNDLLNRFLQQEQPSFVEINLNRYGSNEYYDQQQHQQPNYEFTCLSPSVNIVPIEHVQTIQINNTNQEKPINVNNGQIFRNSDNGNLLIIPDTQYLNLTNQHAQINVYENHQTQYTTISLNNDQCQNIESEINIDNTLNNNAISPQELQMQLLTSHVNNNQKSNENDENDDGDDDDGDGVGDGDEQLGGEKKYVCKLCPYATNHTTNMRKHVKGHTFQEGCFKCRYCEFYLKSGRNIRRHEICHLEYKPASNMFQCELCPFKTTENSYFKKHNLNHKFKEGALKCNYCKYYVETRSLLKAHENLHADIERAETAGIHSCDLCPFKTSHLTNLRKHKSNHDPEGKKAYKQCKYCVYFAKNNTLIKMHEKLHLKMEETFDSQGGLKHSCKLCPYKTCNYSNLARHILNHNFKEGYTKCRYCDYYTSDAATISKHEVIHIDYSPNPCLHACKKCPYKTNKSSNLKAHELKHGPIEGYFKCSFCDYHVKSIGFVEAHEILHKK